MSAACASVEPAIADSNAKRASFFVMFISFLS
jgi:hypothetical protein